MNLSEIHAMKQTCRAKMEDLLGRTAMRHETMGKMILGIGDQVVSGMIKNALISMMTFDMDKEKAAAKAARQMYVAGTELPFPVNIVAAPIMGAAAFASVMAFNAGGIVPGTGRGDVVPAMLTPGEAVLPKAMTEMLTNAASSGSGGGTTVHVHVRASPTIHALDSTSMSAVLDKHAATIAKHVNNQLRRLNR
jgi:hypothetical protein